MTTIISNSLLSKFSCFIENEIGLHFPEKRINDLEKGINAVTKVFNMEDPEACIQWLMSSSLDKSQIQVLASQLTVGETYFFRDTKSFKALEESILPTLIYKRKIENKKQIRIWSAGCASGEESYSIAIILHKLIPDITNWNITLLSTDINIDSLKKFAHGKYTEWSFRGVSDEIKDQFFIKISNKQFEVMPNIKNIVEMSYLNLAQDNYPSLLNNTNAMDIIFCRNVLMYFSQKLSKSIVRKFHECLVSDGCLFVSSVEASQPLFDEFSVENVNGSTVYMKSILKKIQPSIRQLDECIIKKPVKIEIKTNNDKLDKAATTNKKIVNTTNVSCSLIAEEYANKGDLKNALIWNDKAIAESKADMSLHYLRSLILLEMNKLKEAEASLNKVIYLDSGYIQAYIALGNIFQKQNNISLAEKNYRHALLLLKQQKPEKVIGDITANRLIDIIESKINIGH